MVSGKHDWKNSCCVASEDRLLRCLFGVVEANALADVVPEAIVLRRHIVKESENWREKLAELNRETDDEAALLTRYAERLAAVLGGYWSVDFAKGRGGAWYFIDAARGELSWHPECRCS